MPIKFTCPHCRKALSVKDQSAGKKAQCPGCKKPLTIPIPKRAAQPNSIDVEALAAAALADEPKAPAPAATTATIEFKCFYCDETVRVSADLAGKQTPCPECRRIIKVPLLEKNQPKDWRTVDSRLPSGARRDVGPVPEGAWDTASVGVSRQALVEAQAIPQVRPRWTPAQWIKRGSAVAAGVLVVAGVSWMVMNYLARHRQDQALAKALEALTTPDKLGAEGVAEIHRAAGVYALRTASRGSGEEARNHFQQARAAVLQDARIEPMEREAFLIELAVAQVDLGGDRPEVEAEARLPWEAAHREIRQSLQTIASADGRAEGLRQVTRKLVARDQGNAAAGLASLFPEEAAELLAVVGLEMLRAKQDAVAETLAEQALQIRPGPMPPPEGEAKPPTAPPAPSLIALWLALGKPDKAAAVAPPAGGEKGQNLGPLLGTVEGLARQGNLEQARARLRTVSAPEELLPALLAFAVGTADKAAARPELENAFSLLEGERKERPLSPWQLVRLARAGAKAGLDERVQAIARLIPDAAVRGRMQLEVLRQRLAERTGPADETWMQLVDPNTPVHGEALEQLARHNARYGTASAQQQTISGWEEKLQPFGYLGVALGLQDRNP